MVILARSAADGLELWASSYPRLQADLRFASPILELEFQEEEAARSRAAARTPQFHLNRAGIWGVVLLRALASGELGAAALVLVVLVMPAVTASLPQGAYRRWRSPLKAFDNLLQILMGCRTHHLLYPNPASGAPSYFQAAAVLLTGNGVLWQLFNSIWGSIPFRYAVPQQAMLTIVLLLFNRTLCSSNLAIQHAYEAMQRGPSLAARWLWAPLAALQAGPAGLSSCQAERSCAAATLAGSAVAHGPANASLPGAAAGVAGFPSAAAPVVHDGAQLCMALQPVSQLLLGFVLPTFIIWSAELRSRRAFLAARHSDGAAGGAHAELAGAALRHLPGLVDYLMFAVPGVLCMWSMVALHA